MQQIKIINQTDLVLEVVTDCFDLFGGERLRSAVANIRRCIAITDIGKTYKYDMT